MPLGSRDAARRRLQHRAKLSSLTRNASFEVSEGDHQIIYVACGVTKLVAHMSDSRDQVLAFHFVGDIFTVPAPDNYVYSVIALREARLVTFPSDDYLTEATTEPGILRYLLDNTILSLRRSREKVIALGSKTAAERLAVFLLNMAERIGTERDGLCAFDLPMSRRDISESLGLTIETVSRQLTKLRDDGVIETIGRSKVILRRPELLRERAGYSTRSCAISSS